MTTLLGISGALRANSTNTKLVHEAARIFAPDVFQMADLRLPLFDGDLDIPSDVQALADQIGAADAVVISTPEYNKFPPGVLKNALDWVSVTKEKPWQDKPVAVLSAAAGRAGGERSQFFLRLMLTPFRPRMVMGPEVTVAQSGKAFDETGHLSDEFAEKLLGEVMDSLRTMI